MFYPYLEDSRSKFSRPLLQQISKVENYVRTEHVQQVLIFLLLSLPFECRKVLRQKIIKSYKHPTTCNWLPQNNFSGDKRSNTRSNGYGTHKLWSANEGFADLFY